MFENIGWGEMMVIIVAGLFIIGPERLPAAAAWLGRTMRKIRDFATGARQQLKDEMGSDFDELRKPLADLQSLRAMGPRKAITRHLLDGYDPTEDFRQYDMRSEFEEAQLPKGGPFQRGTSTVGPASPVNGASWSDQAAADTNGAVSNGAGSNGAGSNGAGANGAGSNGAGANGAGSNGHTPKPNGYPAETPPAQPNAAHYDSDAT